jgi:bifunctional DNA-binding transcriptional regulator/antitoxin component of YhaV-PrlF toxin-antitoxin module
MEETNTVHMSESGQMLIPAEVRETLHWEGAMDLSIRLTGSGLLIQPTQHAVGGRRLEDLRGLLKHHGQALSDEQLCAPVDGVEEA